MQGNYCIAGHTVKIDSKYGYVHELCGEYRTEAPQEYCVSASEREIAEAMEETAAECAKEHIAPVELPDGAYESVVIYRKIVEHLFQYDFLLFHGSAVAVDGGAYMFIARSGTGKSTHSRLWRELLGEKAVMVNDDKPLVQIGREQAVAYGTPWNGKHRLGSNIAVPLKGICILRRGTENRIREIGLTEAYPMLLQQIHRIPDNAKLGKTMELLDRLERSVKFYVMECNISTEAAQMAYEAMAGHC